jgi:hypothetical protein
MQRRAMSTFNRESITQRSGVRIANLNDNLAGLIRFIPKNGSSPVIGEPVNAAQDVGLASYKSEPIEVETFSGSSILQPGSRTGEKVQVERIVSPLAQEEVGTIRCVGLNVSVVCGGRHVGSTNGLLDSQYVNHAKEVKMEIPTVPTLFM